MGLYGSTPSPPPDYTSQKRRIRLQTEQRYQQQADAYNESVREYNQGLSQLANQAQPLLSASQDFSITNPGSYSFSRDVRDLQSSLARLDQPTRPTFSSSVGSEYGTVGITNIPTLESPSNLSDTLRNELFMAEKRRKDVLADRSAERRRRSNFRSQLMGDLSGLQGTVNNLSIADINEMNQVESDLARIQSRARGFSSPLGGIGGLDYSSVSDPISQLRSQREAELDRIQNFEQSLYTTADDVRSGIGDLTIADIDQINEYQDTLDSARRSASRFSSQLDFDFSDELGRYGLGEPASDLDALLREREEEQNRIQRTEQDFLTRARGLDNMADNASIYSASNLNTIEDELGNLREDISGFSSLLPYDFSRVQDGTLTQVDAALESIRGQRQTALDDILNQVTGATSGLSDIPLYEEEALNERNATLRDLERELGLFSGGRVSNIESQITSGTDAVDARLSELQDRRSQLETRAQELQQQVDEAQYRRTDDLSGASSSVEDLQAEIELYNAQRAIDELNAIQERLQSERVRLEQDAENVAARERLARESLLASVQGGNVPQFRDYALQDPISEGNYSRLLALSRTADEEDLPLSQAPSGSFSRNIGVIRV